MDDEFLTIDEVCEELKISRTTFLDIRKEGFFKPIYIGKSKRFTKQQILDYTAAVAKEREGAR